MQLPVETDSSIKLHPLQQAVIDLTKAGDLATIQKLVKSGCITFQEDTSVPTLCFMNAADNQKNLLHYALIEKHQALADYYCANLLPRFLTAAFEFGYTPLYYAVHLGYADVIMQLLNADVSVLHAAGKLNETVIF